MASSIQVVARLQDASVFLEPTRLRLVAHMQAPTTAASLAKQMGLPRQRVSYHLHELEKAGVIRFVEERKKGNCVERVYVATAASYLLDPSLLGSLAADPDRVAERQSSAYLIAVSARVIQELAVQRDRAGTAGKDVPTISLLSEVRFASAEDRRAFGEDLANAVAQVAREYHSPAGEEGVFKVMVGGYPAITESESPGRTGARGSQAEGAG